MQKTILITGSTDGIGLETAKNLVSQGHHVILHGRNAEKLERVMQSLSTMYEQIQINGYTADLSRLSEVTALAETVMAKHPRLDILINNAGVYKTANPITEAGLDVRFVVNTLAPYLLTQKLLPAFTSEARVVNLSSAAQAPINCDALMGKVTLSNDFDAYAQSKLALTIWSQTMAQSLKDTGPVLIAVNPGSLLATKMVKQGFGVAGHDIGIGADILTRLALDDEFKYASGLYFDNDKGQFSSPHVEASDPDKTQQVMIAIEATLMA